MQRLSKKILSTFSVLATAILLTACGAKPVKNVESNAVPSNIKSAEQVKLAIQRAGTGLGWMIKEKDSHTLEGTLLLRKHIAQITIPYSKTEYSLLYKTSENLSYDQEANTIHNNYNGWIMNLDRAIQLQLLQ
jgi:hypothetical protein